MDRVWVLSIPLKDYFFKVKRAERKKKDVCAAHKMDIIVYFLQVYGNRYF